MNQEPKDQNLQWIPRLLEDQLQHHLQRGKSVLLLGPRQTGKTSLIERQNPNLKITFLSSRERQRYERDPHLLVQEIESFIGEKSIKNPLIVVDEVQKVPAIMNEIQYLIDRKRAQFILTGSSARKLKLHSDVNLLPGRVVLLRMDPVTYLEYPKVELMQLLADGSLPQNILEKSSRNREEDLETYVQTYLEDEIRREAVVRNLSHFSRFLEWACLESGKIVSFRAIADDIGISHTTVSAYYQILEDCLVAERVDPISKSTTRKKLSKSSRYIIFDLGVRRLGAREAALVSAERLGECFEQWVALELIRYSRMTPNRFEVCYWKDGDGPEVDLVIKTKKGWIPIEVKWSEKPKSSDAKHLETFLSEYKETKPIGKGFVICRIEKSAQLTKNCIAIPWKELHRIIDRELD